MFLALSFVNGCVLEIGRKLWAPENEIAGVDTYSGLWGPRRAAAIWGVTVSCRLHCCWASGARRIRFWWH
jgi:hypothetical protein